MDLFHTHDAFMGFMFICSRSGSCLTCPDIHRAFMGYILDLALPYFGYVTPYTGLWGDTVANQLVTVAFLLYYTVVILPIIIH